MLPLPSLRRRLLLASIAIPTVAVAPPASWRAPLLAAFDSQASTTWASEMLSSASARTLPQASVPASTSNGTVAGGQVLAGGTGYASGTTVRVVDPDNAANTSASATLTVSFGRIEAVNISVPGSGYGPNTGFVIENAGATASGASLRLNFGSDAPGTRTLAVKMAGWSGKPRLWYHIVPPGLGDNAFETRFESCVSDAATYPSAGPWTVIPDALYAPSGGGAAGTYAARGQGCNLPAAAATRWFRMVFTNRATSTSNTWRSGLFDWNAAEPQIACVLGDSFAVASMQPVDLMAEFRTLNPSGDWVFLAAHRGAMGCIAARDEGIVPLFAKFPGIPHILWGPGTNGDAPEANALLDAMEATGAKVWCSSRNCGTSATAAKAGKTEAVWALDFSGNATDGFEWPINLENANGGSMRDPGKWAASVLARPAIKARSWDEATGWFFGDPFTGTLQNIPAMLAEDGGHTPNNAANVEVRRSQWPMFRRMMGLAPGKAYMDMLIDEAAAQPDTAAGRKVRAHIGFALDALEQYRVIPMTSAQSAVHAVRKSRLLQGATFQAYAAPTVTPANPTLRADAADGTEVFTVSALRSGQAARGLTPRKGAFSLDSSRLKGLRTRPSGGASPVAGDVVAMTLIEVLPEVSPFPQRLSFNINIVAPPLPARVSGVYATSPAIFLDADDNDAANGNGDTVTVVGGKAARIDSRVAASRYADNGNSTQRPAWLAPGAGGINGRASLRSSGTSFLQCSDATLGALFAAEKQPFTVFAVTRVADPGSYRLGSVRQGTTQLARLRMGSGNTGHLLLDNVGITYEESGTLVVDGTRAYARMLTYDGASLQWWRDGATAGPSLAWSKPAWAADNFNFGGLDSTWGATNDLGCMGWWNKALNASKRDALWAYARASWATG